MPSKKQWIFLWCFTSAVLKLFDPELMLRVQVVMTDGDTKEITVFEDAIASLFVRTKMRHCFWHFVEQHFQKMFKIFKEGSAKMKVFQEPEGMDQSAGNMPRNC